LHQHTECKPQRIRKNYLDTADNAQVTFLVHNDLIPCMHPQLFLAFLLVLVHHFPRLLFVSVVTFLQQISGNKKFARGVYRDNVTSVGIDHFCFYVRLDSADSLDAL